MSIIKSCIIAFAMYSKIPMPHVEWEEKSMRYAMAFFPLVGAVIGGCMTAWWHVAAVRNYNVLFTGAVFAVLPLLISGGIHMDGFLDTMDALGSCRPREEKLDILKDPHAGAFAIISAAAYMALYTGGDDTAPNPKAGLAFISCLCLIKKRKRPVHGDTAESKKGRHPVHIFFCCRCEGSPACHGVLYACRCGSHDMDHAVSGQCGVCGCHGLFFLVLADGGKRVWRNHR